MIAGQERFLWGELFGFVLLVTGTLVYNEIIEIPISLMNHNTKSNIEKRELQASLKKKELDQDQDENDNIETEST